MSALTVTPETYKAPSPARQSDAIFYRIEPNAREALLVLSNIDISITNFSYADIASRFYNLAEKWEQDNLACSSVHQMYRHPAYSEIIDLGPSILPLLLSELKRQPNFWFGALTAITGADPVKHDHLGYLDKMAKDWLDWAKENSIPIITEDLKTA